MKLLLHRLQNVKGDVSRPFLAREAALSLATIEKDTDGLIYRDMWRDAVSSLLARRMRKTSQLPGYSAHNYGLAVDLDVGAILAQKKILYEDLLWLMKRRGWYCFRRDGAAEQTGSDHFNFLGEAADHYLSKCTLDPTTWSAASEIKIWEFYHEDFQISTKDVQLKLAKIGFFNAPFTEQRDIYTREAIMAFQRAWDLIQSGSPDMSLCRVLSFVTADINIT
jgi:hypothetical protein